MLTIRRPLRSSFKAWVRSWVFINERKAAGMMIPSEHLSWSVSWSIVFEKTLSIVPPRMMSLMVGFTRRGSWLYLKLPVKTFPSPLKCYFMLVICSDIGDVTGLYCLKWRSVRLSRLLYSSSSIFSFIFFKIITPASNIQNYLITKWFFLHSK